jgi:hypothetical protein
MDPKKATSDYLSKCNGRFSWAMSSTEKKNASIGMRATNDPSEGEYATFTEVLATGGSGIRVDKGMVCVLVLRFQGAVLQLHDTNR